MKQIVFIVLSIVFAIPSWAALNAPLTVQEAIYPGGSNGVTRTNEPFCVGVPIADSAQISGSSTSTLGLTGASAGQFRVIGKWPSGNAKWVEVCGIVPSLSAGGTAAVTLTDSGSGNFGGPNLAVDNGGTVTVATGTSTFTIKKANFNGLDSVVTGDATVVAPSTSAARGLVLMGPDPNAAFPANVTCGTGAGQSPCTTLYSSANDPASTCAIEKNGPVTAVLRCVGNHMDAAGHPYMQYTVRETFYKGKDSVKVTTVLRNANYDTAHTPSNDCNAVNGSCTGQTFNTAYKGMQSYELRINPSLTGSLKYSMASYDADPNCSGGVCTGTLDASSADNVNLYQAQSQSMTNQDCPYQSACANVFTPQTGFSVVRNGANQTTGTGAQFPQGWADISNANGAGVEIGVYQLAAYWPKSLEFNGGGTDARIGIFPRENSQPVYQAWPQWHRDDLLLNFHATASASLSGEFLKFQHPLIARADVAYYNATNVFPFPMGTASDEDSYLTATAASANPTLSVSNFCYSGGPTNCIPDLGTTSSLNLINRGLEIQRYWVWSKPFQLNQKESRWSDLQTWIKRGQPGRYLESTHFYKMQSESAWPHADGVSMNDATVNGFRWKDRPRANAYPPELDGFGHPKVQCSFNTVGFTGDTCPTIANWSYGVADWMDQLHFHWYGMTDYYFMTGDETAKESMTPMLDWFLNDNTYQTANYATVGGGLGTMRGVAENIISAVRFSEYLASIGDTANAAPVLQRSIDVYNYQIKPDLCVSGFPAGCIAAPIDHYPAAGYDIPGVSKVRGTPWNTQGRGQEWCAADQTHAFRGNDLFQSALLVESLLYLRRGAGASWAESENALDLAYGISSWALTESFLSNGSNKWFDTPNNGNYHASNGFSVGIVYDTSQQCNTPNGLGGTAGTDVGHGPLVQLGSAVYDPYALVNPDQSMWMLFYPQILVNGSLTSDQVRKFNLAVQNVGANSFAQVPDWGQYQMGAIIQAVQHPASGKLQDVQIAVQDLGSGNYKLTWTEPTGTQYYRLKWCCSAPYGPKVIANSGGYATIPAKATGVEGGLLGFDPQVSQTFTLNPNTYMTWFGSNAIGSANEPQPGTTSVSISTGVSGLTQANFSLKSFVGSGGAAPTPVTPTPPVSGTATSLVTVSGNAQTGSTGQPLSNPFTVKAVDANGNPVSGVNVSFTITAGGGTVTPAQTTTNSQGLASSTLTLGPAAGTNSVSATAGSLSGSPLIFTATAVNSSPTPAPSPSGNGQVNWTLPAPTSGWPSYVGYQVPQYDPVSQQTLFYVGPPSGVHGIYSTDIYAYNSATNVFTHIAGTGNRQEVCPADTATQPGDRHPGWQMAVDTKRGKLWLYGGVNQTCNGWSVTTNGTAVTAASTSSFVTDGSWNNAQVLIGGATYTIVSVTDSTHLTLNINAGVKTAPVVMTLAAPNTNPRQDMYYLQLNPNPANDTWHQVTPVHLPATIIAVGAMVYDPDDDVLFAFGYDGGSNSRNNWVYCRTAENPTPGTPTSLQSAAGCTVPDDWNVVNPAGGVQPPGAYFTGMVYDTATRKVIQYGGGLPNGTTFYNQTWAYDVPTHTWTQKALSTTPPPVYSGSYTAQPALAYNPTAHKLLYHQTSGSGAPADWQYDPAADTWQKLTSSGSGATIDQVMAYDAAHSVLIGWSINAATGLPDIWHGSLSTAATSPTGGSSTTCDLNGDGVVNGQDVQLAIRQALGLDACGGSALTGNGSCSVIDVQRVVNASLGGACQVGN